MALTQRSPRKKAHSMSFNSRTQTVPFIKANARAPVAPLARPKAAWGRKARIIVVLSTSVLMKLRPNKNTTSVAETKPRAHALSPTGSVRTQRE